MTGLVDKKCQGFHAVISCTGLSLICTVSCTVSPCVTYTQRFRNVCCAGLGIGAKVTILLFALLIEQLSRNVSHPHKRVVVQMFSNLVVVMCDIVDAKLMCFLYVGAHASVSN